MYSCSSCMYRTASFVVRLFLIYSTAGSVLYRWWITWWGTPGSCHWRPRPPPSPWCSCLTRPATHVTVNKPSTTPQRTHRVNDGKISPGWWGGAAHPFQPITITYKVAVYAPADWADTLTLFHLYPYICSVVHANQSILYIVHTANGWGNEISYLYFKFKRMAASCTLLE